MDRLTDVVQDNPGLHVPIVDYYRWKKMSTKCTDVEGCMKLHIFVTLIM